MGRENDCRSVSESYVGRGLVGVGAEQGVIGWLTQRGQRLVGEKWRWGVAVAVMAGLMLPKEMEGDDTHSPFDPVEKVTVNVVDGLIEVAGKVWKGEKERAEVLRLNGKPPGEWVEAHAANDVERVMKILASDGVDVADGDVQRIGSGFDEGAAVMSHDPVNGPAMETIDWMNVLVNSGKVDALKLDFKSGGAWHAWWRDFERVYLQGKVRPTTLILNANVVQADGGGSVTMDGKDFVQACAAARSVYEEATGGEGRVIISLAFAEVGSRAYSRGDVKRMMKVLEGVEGEVTVVLKADKLMANPQVLLEFLANPKVGFITVYGVNQKNEGEVEEMLAEYPTWVRGYVLVEAG